MNKTLKIVASGMALGLMATGALAELNIAWGAAAGFYPSGGDGSTGIIDTGQSALVQLIFSPDNEISDALPGGLTSEGEEVLVQAMVANNGAAFADFAFFTGPALVEPYRTGYVYGRVFESDVAAPSSWYYAGPVSAIQDLGPLASPQVVQINRNTALGDELNLQVVPEPTTLALLALGVGTVLFRRRRAA